MNWYLARITYRIICGQGKHIPQFDEQLRLISAANESEALVKAKALGEAGSQVFFNNDHQLVRWQFINITDICSISEWTDGAEVYSSITEADNADAYIDLVTDKAALLDNRYVS
jgi:hypothetical protein